MRTLAILLQEITLKYHKNLNPILWDGETMKKDVRDSLLKIADQWIDYCHIPPESIVDIIVTGGNAGYLYNKYSDIDLHTIVDYSKIDSSKEILDDYFYDKKKDFSEEFSPKCEGYEVELYAQPSDDKLVASAVYSLKNDSWIKKPKYEKGVLSKDVKTEIEKKEKYFLDSFKDAVKNKKSKDYVKRLKDRIANLRKSGLSSGSEFDPDNLTFKELRNKKLLDKIDKYVGKK